MELYERQPPFNIEAERHVLGCILKDANALATALEFLRPEDFFAAQNIKIMQCAVELFNNNTPVDVVTVGNALGSQLQAVGGTVYLSQLVADVFTVSGIKHYIDIIVDKALLRRLLVATDAISKDCYEQTLSSNEVIDNAQKLIFDILQNRLDNGLQPIRSVLYDSIRSLENLRLRGNKIIGVPTGFSELDRITAGLQKSDLILIAARPAMGKTSFALNIAQNAAINHNIPVAIFSLEMAKEQLVNRIIWSEALIPSEKLRTGDINLDDMRNIAHALSKLGGCKIFVDDTPGITVTDIRAKCRRLKLNNQLGLIIIDYLQLMDSPDSRRQENRQQSVSAISRSLKILAKELNVPVVTLSQLSRACESRPNKRPLLSDLRESGAIEQDADIVMFLYRDEYYFPETEEKNVAECIISKHRNGSIGTVKLGWRGEFTSFMNLQRN